MKNIHRRPSRAVASAISFWMIGFVSATTHAQTPATSPHPPLPLFSGVHEIMFLDQAKESSARASAFEAANEPLDAVQEYERLIEASAKLSQLQHSCEYYLVIAGAHLDAARARMDYSTALSKNLDLTEQNVEKVKAHLMAIPDLVVTASKLATTGDEHFRCEARKLLANGFCFRGIVYRSSSDLLKAIDVLHEIEKCDPSATAQTREMISYAKTIEADISQRLFRADNVAKMISKVVSIAVPRVGSYLSAAIDVARDSQKQKQQSRAVPRGPR